MKINQQTPQPNPFPFNISAQNIEQTKTIATAVFTPLASQGKKAAQTYVEQIFNHLRFYFDVTNRYVLQKCKVVLFPFQKNWDRTLNRDGEPQPPRYDSQSPDLYLPNMAFITFILLKVIYGGINKTFTPEQMGVRFSTGLVLTSIELLISYVAFTLFGLHIPVLDILAIISYKFVNLCLIMILTLIVNEFFYPIWIFQSCCLFIFLFKTFQSQHKFTLQGQMMQQLEINKSGYGIILLFICVMEVVVLAYYCFRV